MEKEKCYNFLAIVSYLLCKISKKVLHLCTVIFPQVTLFIDFCSFTSKWRHCNLVFASVIEWETVMQLVKYIYLCTIPQSSVWSFMFFSFWSLCTVELT